MPQYVYQGIDITGGSEAGTIEASTEGLAFDTLQARGITVFDLTLDGTATAIQVPWYRRDISFRSNKMSFEGQAGVAELLATLFGARLSATEVIRIAGLSTDNSDIKRHFERVGQRVADGVGFATAFDEENRLFSPMFIAFLQVSDVANEMPRLLNDLARYLRRMDTARQKVVSALIYPAILVLAAIALLFVVIFYLAPNLEPIFASVGKEPPGTIAALLALNEVIRSYWLILLGALVAVLILGAAALRLPPARALLSRIQYRIPYLGKMMKLAALARLTEGTGLLLSSGQSLPDALRLSGRIMGGLSGFSITFQEAADTLEAGQMASTVFSHDRAMPSMFKELFRIGEETNKLPETLTALAETMSSQADRQSQRFLNLVTPGLTLVLGLGIGALIYTLMGAILEVNELAF